jgi:hypothetical protein
VACVGEAAAAQAGLLGSFRGAPPSMRSWRNGSYARSAPLVRFRISCRASLTRLDAIAIRVAKSSIIVLTKREGNRPTWSVRRRLCRSSRRLRRGFSNRALSPSSPLVGYAGIPFGTHRALPQNRTPRALLEPPAACVSREIRCPLCSNPGNGLPLRANPGNGRPLFASRGRGSPLCSRPGSTK